MDQELGLGIERQIGPETYLSSLPRDLKTLLYQYVYLKSKFGIDETNSSLVLYGDNVALCYSYDVSFIKTHLTNMDKRSDIRNFINDVLAGNRFISYVYMSENIRLNLSYIGFYFIIQFLSETTKYVFFTKQNQYNC